jgi:sigma-B regulation protein RsbU (phosphoserine phosphatase)
MRKPQNVSEEQQVTKASRATDYTQAVKTDTGFLMSVLGHFPDGLVVADERGNCLYVNEAAERILGNDLREHLVTDWAAVYGLCLPDAVTPYPSERLPLARAIRGEDIPETEVYIKNARVPLGLWISMKGRSLGDARGVARGGVLVMRDITSRKRSQELVQRLSSVVEQTADSVIITDTSGVIEYVNSGFENITGYAREEVLGTKPNILKSGMHDEEYYTNLWSTVHAGGVFRGTIINRRKNGEIYYSDQTITPMKQAGGNTSHFVSVGKDITHVIRAAEDENKMKLARTVQQKLYPHGAPELEHFDLAGAAYPADATGGDCFDYLPMQDESLCIAIGDVSGHGIATALVMAQTRAYLRSISAASSAVDDILRSLNGTLVADRIDEHYVTMLLARIDPRAGILVYSNAGHPAWYVLDSRGAVKSTLSSTSMPLGMFSEWDCGPCSEISLEPGDLMVLVTDGVSETENNEGDVFGVDRTLEYVCHHRHEAAQDLVSGLYHHVRDFAGGAQQNDDITAVVCKMF